MTIPDAGVAKREGNKPARGRGSPRRA